MRSPERTQQRILEAALEAFSARGLAGARVDQIARAAGVNKRMIYHYFGDKDGLFEAVLADQLSEVALSAEPGEGGNLDALQRAAAASPTMVRLLTWESLATAALPGNRARERAPGVERWRQRVVAAQARGALPRALDPAQLQLALTAWVLFPVAFPSLTRMITGKAPDDHAYLDARAEFIEALRNLAKPAPEAVPPAAKPRYRLPARIS